MLESNQKVKENVNFIVENEKDVTLLLVHDEQIQAKKNIWYLENSVSNYMCENKDKFMELNASIQGNVAFANHSKVSIK